jgi:hypothetical protein
MSINVVCDCGKETKVKDELAGKKIKCPGCQSVLTVPEAGDEVATGPPPRTGARAAADEDVAAGSPRAGKRPAFADEEDDEESEREPKRGKKKKAAKNSKTMLFAAIGGGVVLLGCCCLGVGIGGYFLFFAGGGSPEKVIVGKWKVDIEETKKNLPESEKKGADFVLAFMSAVTFEFKSDNNFSMDFAGNSSKGKWKIASSKGSTATIEITEENKKEPLQWEVTVVNNDRIRVVNKSDKGDKGDKGPKEIVLKRV